MKKIEVPLREELYHLYIELGYSIKQLESLYGCSAKPIKKWLRNYNITKSKEQRLAAAEKACTEKYGAAYPFGSANIQNKAQNTLKKRYADSSWVKNMQENRVLTFRKKYEVDNAGQLASTKRKSEETSFRKWGVSHYTKTPEYKKRAQQTNLARLGVLYPMQSKIVQSKAKDTVRTRHGVDNVAQSDAIKEKKKNTIMERYGVPSYSQTEEFNIKITTTNKKRYGVPYGCMTQKCREASGNTISKINLWWKTFLNAKEAEFVVNHFSYDLKIGNTLIEINPAYTHNSTKGAFFNGKQKEPLSQDYHKNKLLAAENAGFSCLYIWDWDNPEVIKDMLSSDKVIIKAKDCILRVISNEEAISFLRINHIHKEPCNISLSVGLYFQDLLVSVMSFKELNTKYQFELSRFCNKLGYIVEGSDAKLFRYFLNYKKPRSVVAYSDLCKLPGTIYEDLGFSLEGTTDPCEHWYNTKEHTHIYSPDKESSIDSLISKGFVAIYDCGKKVWVYSN